MRGKKRIKELKNKVIMITYYNLICYYNQGNAVVARNWHSPHLHVAILSHYCL